MTFATNRVLPPLAFEDGLFDLVYAVSVFTHIDRFQQKEWLKEFRRLLRPGGALLLTIYSDAVLDGLNRKTAQKVRESGHAFCRSEKLKGICPAWYHTAFQTRQSLEDSMRAEFRTSRYFPQALGRQDIAIAGNGRDIGKPC